MCKAKDVALAILKKSIDLVRKNDNNSSYFMDYIKLHKLMYVGQCMALAKYDVPLFEEPVAAHNCGPYIENELDFVAAIYGFSQIQSLSVEKNNPVVLPLPILRNEIADELLEKFGRYTTDEIVKLVKDTPAYTKYRGQYDNKPVISHEDMKMTGKRLLNM